MSVKLAIYKVNEGILLRLKHPLGRLVIGSSERTINILREVIKNEKPTKLIAIGDVVTSNIIRKGIEVDCIVIDFKSKRQPVEAISLNNFEVVNIKNPAGVITIEAYEAVKIACKKLDQGSSAIAIVVDGEEDLITLPIVKFAPLGSLVVYGQPHVGIVLIKVTNRIKIETELIMNKMVNKCENI